MTDNDTEAPAITLAKAAVVGAFALGILAAIIGGAFVGTARMTDVNALAGGWTAIGTGALLALLGGEVAYATFVTLRRVERNHAMVMHELTQLRDMLVPADEVERRRTSG